MANSEAPSTVKSAIRTLDILEFLVGHGRPMAAHELSTALAIPVSSLSYLLTTLVERGYLERSGRQYAPGAALARLNPGGGSGASLADRVTPLVRSLRVQLNETAGFFVRRGFAIEAVASETGLHALRYTIEMGRQVPMHAFSAGKALLAAMPADELDRYFREVEREAFTPNTVTDEGELRAELKEVRRTGIARTREDYTPGIVGLGRAARIDGAVAGAFSVALPAARFTPEVEARTVALLEKAAALLEVAGGPE